MTSPRSDEDEAKRHALIEELVALFQREGFSISGADGVDGYFPPPELHNDGYGDQEDKMPDVYAFAGKENRYMIGMARTGMDDLESEDALTRYNVFLDQIHPQSRQHARLYIILPAARVTEFNTLITHYIHYELWENLVLVQSQKWPA